VVKEIVGGSQIEGVVLHHATEGEADAVAVDCDAVLLQLGFSTRLGPLKDWGFDLVKGAIRVSPTMQTSLERVWACGDIATSDGKLKLIATGFGEAAIAVGQAVLAIRPDMTLQPGYSTNTGVPGAVVGQP
jgi:thioredoxin reductase (NADPH)